MVRPPPAGKELNQPHSEARNKETEQQQERIQQVQDDPLHVQQGQDDPLHVQQGQDDSLHVQQGQDHPMFNKDKMTHFMFSKDKMTHFRFNKDKMTHFMFNKDRRLHCMFSKDKMTHFMINKDKMTHFMFSKDKMTHFMFSKDKMTHFMFNKDKMTHVVFNKDKRVLFMFSNDKMTHFMINKDKMTHIIAGRRGTSFGQCCEDSMHYLMNSSWSLNGQQGKARETVQTRESPATQLPEDSTFHILGTRPFTLTRSVIEWTSLWQNLHTKLSHTYSDTTSTVTQKQLWSSHVADDPCVRDYIIQKHRRVKNMQGSNTVEPHFSLPLSIIWLMMRKHLKHLWGPDFYHPWLYFVSDEKTPNQHIQNNNSASKEAVTASLSSKLI